MTDIGHNIDAVTAGQLLAIIERVERVNGEIKALNDDKSDIFAEAKSNGFDPKIIKEVVKIRAQDRDARMEHDEILSCYLAALGMS